MIFFLPIKYVAWKNTNVMFRFADRKTIAVDSYEIGIVFAEMIHKLRVGLVL